MSKPDWREVSTSLAEAYELRTPTLTVRVHFAIFDRRWLVTCRDLDIANSSLLASDAHHAKKEALNRLGSLVAQYAKEISEVLARE